MNNATNTDIQRDLSRFSSAWNANDGGAVGGCFTEDGSLVNPFGERAEGRAAVGAMYSEYFGGLLRGSSTAIELRAVRPLGEGLAFTDSEQTIFAPDGAVLLQVKLSALLRREVDGWRFLDARPYTLPPTQS